MENIESDTPILNGVLEKSIKYYFEKYLKRKPDKEGLEHFISQIRDGKLTLKDFPKLLKQSREYKLLNQKIPESVVTIYDIKLFLDKNDMMVSKSIALDKFWEREETDLLEKFIDEGMCVVDVGSHIGYYTTLFAKWVGRSGKVISIEPDPFNFQLLLKNIKTNQFSNVSVFQKALSNNNEKAILFQSVSNKGDHRIIDFQAYDTDSQKKKELM